ncbi:MAG: hypothetical protein QXT84_01185, partial [Candidatus Bathyarchaeia archaeon]
MRENERRLLIALRDAGGRATINRIAEISGLASAAIIRAALSLEAKNLAKIHEKKVTKISLNEEGKQYAERGLPERIIAEILERIGGESSINEVLEAASIKGELAPIALGWAVRKGWAAIDSKSQKIRILRKPDEGSDEKLLRMLKDAGELILEDLDEDLKKAFNLLKGRKIIVLREETLREIELTKDGWSLLERGLEPIEEITQLTPELIVTGKWREKRIARYDIKAPAPRVWPGKKHPYLRFLDEVCEKLIALGFKEMRGPIVEISLFNCDGLYMP